MIDKQRQLSFIWKAKKSIFPAFLCVSVPLWLISIVLLSGCVGSPSAQENLKRYEFQQAQMGMPFRMVLYAPDEQAANAASDAAFARIKQLNDILSDYDADSELCRLSATSGSGQEVKVGDDLWLVLRRAQELAERSNGAFDVTVGPYSALWRKARRERKMPDPALLAKAAKAVGYKNVRLNLREHSVTLLAPGMRLDLGGIAKGYAVDEALKVLQGRGVRRALVAGGGDMAVAEPPPGKKGWRIELPPLDTPNAPPARFLLLQNAALATSGDLFQRLEIDGKRYSHVVDPRTGIGLTDHSLVNLIAPNCMTADSLTKVLSVDPTNGLAFVSKVPRVGARIVRQPGEQIEIKQSKLFERYFDKDAKN